MNRFQRGLIHVINWLYIWLPRLMGCHKREDRSFRWRSGLPFPVCARCTGELAGILLAACTAWLWTPPVWLQLVLVVPLVADGFLQLLTRYESTNPRRFVTGVLFGFSLVHLFVTTSVALMRFGISLGIRLRAYLQL